ncbi:hypothetical protein B0H11DRAFT_1371511 [Mycena galericulata]|nr:hypothetical protein B0H11DRAFT_1371511 [Mycena galericulata]
MATRDPHRLRIVKPGQEIAQIQMEQDILLAFPVITLPVEITSQIFIHCLPDDPLDFNASESAVLLGSVCRQWRDIALSVPQLWSTWSLAIDGYTPLGRIRASLKLWFARSKNHPLSIRLRYMDSKGQDTSSADEMWWERASDRAPYILAIILEHHQRWKNIEFNIPVTFLENLTSPDSPPYLTHLSLGSAQEDWGGSDATAEPIAFLGPGGAAPQLRSLHITLEKQNHLSRFDEIQIPYAQLTSFTGTMFGPLESLYVLSRMPALIECVFYITRTARVEANHAFSSPVSLPHLKSLQLWSTGTRTQQATVLDELEAPSLETLALGRQDMSLEFTLASFGDIRHFSCESVDPDDLSDCLENMAELLTLELLDYDQQDLIELLHHFHWKLENDVPLLPRLESITLHCQKKRHHGDFSFHALLLLLEAMVKRPGSALRSCRLVWTTSLLPRRPHVQELERLEDLVKDGMDIYIGSSEGPSWV